MSTGGIARATVPVVSSFLISDLEISAAQFGLSVTVMIALVAIGVPLFGILADRFGARRVLVLRGGGAGLALFGLAASQGYGQLIASQALLGFMTAGGVPASNRVIAEAVPATLRGLAVGIKQSGATMGVLVAGAMIPIVAVAWGWRLGIGVAATISMLTIPAILALVPRTRIASPKREPGRSPWVGILANPSTRWLSANGFLSGIGIAMVFSFLPLYGVQEVGVSPTQAGQTLALMSLMAIAARISWGRISDVSDDVGKPLRRISLLSILAVAAIAFAGVLGPWALWLGAALAGLSMEAWNSLAGSGIIAAVPISSAGRASSVVQVAFMSGNAVGPALFGATVDASGAFYVGWGVCCCMFVVAALMRYRPVPPLGSAVVEGAEVVKRIQDG